MPAAWMTVEPWDILDAGFPALLDRLKGEVGITGLALWATMPPRMRLTMSAEGPRLIRTRGGCFFHHQADAYASTRCKPLAADQLRQKDPVAMALEACTARGMDLRLMASASCTGRLAERHPDMAVRNALGAPSTHALCLSNPDVEAWLIALVADLNQQFGNLPLVLTDFAIAWPDLRAEYSIGDFPAGVAAGSVHSEPVRGLLSQCFCESCGQAGEQAGVDVAAARRSALVELERAMSGEYSAEDSFDAAMYGDDPPAAFFDVKQRQLVSLLERLTGASGDIVLYHDPADGGGLCLEMAVARTVVMSRVAYTSDLATARFLGAKRSEICVPLPEAGAVEGENMVKLWSEAARDGFAAVQVDALGWGNESAFSTLRQAIRYARRLSESLP